MPSGLGDVAVIKVSKEDRQMSTESETEMVATGTIDGKLLKRFARDYAWLWHAVAPGLYLHGQLTGFALARDVLHRFSRIGCSTRRSIWFSTSP